MNNSTQKKVTVFSTPTCPWCKVTKEYLDSHKVTYQDIDVSKDQESARKMVMKSGQMGVPQIWIEDNVIVGFNKNAIDNALGL